MKVVAIVGARPQFVKAAAVSRALRARGVQEVLVHTGQHYDENMSGSFFRQLELSEPQYSLNVGSGSHGAQTGKMLTGIESVLLAEAADWVLVYGDTNSTLAGALAAAKMGRRLAHVEAGLRSFNRQMPEELNRVLADHASDLLFAPTQAAVENLNREGIAARSIELVGDVMYDAVLHYTRDLAADAILARLQLRERGYVLATLHRAENTDNVDRLRSLLMALELVSEDIEVVLPLHPRTRAAMERHGLTVARVKVIEPQAYLDMLALERSARLIATDSGGVQKEAFFFRVPCCTLRAETEWVELLALGSNRLCPPAEPRIIAESVVASLDMRGQDADPYGGGRAADRIVDTLMRDSAIGTATRS